MVAVGTFWGCTTLLGLDDLEYRDQDAGALPDADHPPEAGSVLWSRQMGGPGDDKAEGVAVDPAGEAVVSGCRSPPDSGMTSCIMENDVFASRYSAEGELRWSKTFGDVGNQSAEDLAGGASGAVLVGYFSNNFDFGGPPLVNEGAVDIFVAKLGPDGEQLWSASFGGGANEQASRVATDSDENVLVTGIFDNTVDFGEGPLNGGPLGENPFLAKFNASGGVTWSQHFPGGQTRPLGLASDKEGNVLLTGRYKDSIMLGDMDGGTLNAPPVYADAFVASFDPSGTLRWAVRIRGDDFGIETGLGVSADGDGNVVVVGTFNGTLELGTSPMPPMTKGGDDIFVAKFARDSGMLSWSTVFGGPGDDRPHDVIVDEAGNVLITGEFGGTADFQGASLDSKGLQDAFLVMLEPNNGSLQWARRFGDIGDDIGHRLAFGPAGEVFMVGSFSGTIQFGEEFLPSVGGSDGFLVKFAPP
jgi:hypothetical protein